MTETEPKIVFIDQAGNAIEVKPTSNPGANNLLADIRAVLAAGVESGLFETNPFIIAQPVTVIASTEQEEVTARPTTPFVQSNREHTLELAALHYRERLQDPQRMHDYYQALWDYYGIELMGLSQKDTRVADVPFREDDIWQFMKLENPQEGNRGVDLGYFHLPVLASGDVNARILIGKGFANLGASWVFQRGYEVINGHQISGWMRVDASLDAPYRINNKGELKGLNLEELKEVIAVDKRMGQTINIYGPSGNVIKQIFDYYPDQGSTYSRLPESSEDGIVLFAFFDLNGHFVAGSYRSCQDRVPWMCGRSFLAERDPSSLRSSG